MMKMIIVVGAILDIGILKWRNLADYILYWALGIFLVKHMIPGTNMYQVIDESKIGIMLIVNFIGFTTGS